MADNFTIGTAGGVQIVVAAKDLSSVWFTKHLICAADGTIAGFDNSGVALKVSAYGKGSAAGDTAMPAMDTAAHPGFVAITDGTTGGVAVKAASTRAAATDKALVVRPMMPTNGTQDMPSGDTAARSLFVTPNDGTTAITVKAATVLAALATDTALVVAPLPASNGTQSAPIGDAKARRAWSQPSDGTNDFLSASLANLQAFTEQNSLLVSQAGEKAWTDSIVTGTTTPTATATAPGASKIYTVKWISITLAATADQVPLLFKLIQDTGGTPVTLWQGSLAALAKTCQTINIRVNIPQTVANKALDLSVTAGTIVSTNYITVSFGTTTSV